MVVKLKSNLYTGPVNISPNSDTENVMYNSKPERK